MTAEQLAVWVAGLIASPLTQWVKKTFGDIEGWRALWTFFGVSIVLSLLALLLTTEISITAMLTDPIVTMQNFLAALVQVIGLATVIYKIWIDQPGRKETA